jgi:CubicO group peptidase (beta-lactamase class C family)
MKIIYLFLLIPTICFSKNSTTELDNFLFAKPDKGVVTEAFVVSKNGNIVFKKYEKGNSSTRHLLWSMTKSFGSILFGIAESKGYVNKEDSLIKYFKKEIESQDKKRSNSLAKIKLKHLLGMSSGLAWNEFYEKDPFNSHVVRMLYFESKKSVVNYILKTPARYEPGTRFNYSSGDSNLISGVLKKALPKELELTYPWKFLFDPMEMSATYEVDADNVFLGSSYLYLTTKDMMKFGQLILDKGIYKGEQIVPSEYIDYVVGLNIPMKEHGRCLVDSYMTYGGQFWLNHPCSDGKKPFTDAPGDLIMLLGHGGQSIFIFPGQNIVAVRIARDSEKALDKNKYSKLILEAAREYKND